ncbi:cupin domain-containing protein [Streptomyces uncialis]|uniref:cupin domain-containing protein n=1 Tax=Streptomyces uncialis TaxID=1048205 RepID=UPI0022510CEB|nr:cupin domain-containing protein [Streptomyces uncialis]MCX4658366.1 cupin domain-containing protein [Streptomyces uncialis]
MLTARYWIDALGLEAHVEGGYFRRTFQADHRPTTRTPDGDRYTLTSIHYLLTHWTAIGHWHLNRSDVLHFHQHGEPVTYHLLHPDGRHSTVVLGQDPRQGHTLTLAVPGGVWKASHLTAGDHALISEAVAPGFDWADLTLGRYEELTARFPGHSELVHRYCRPDGHPSRPTSSPGAPAAGTHAHEQPLTPPAPP